MDVMPQLFPRRGGLGALALSACSVVMVQTSLPFSPSMAASPEGIATPAIQGIFLPAETPVRGGFKIQQAGSRTMLELSNDFKTSDLAPDLKIAFSASRTPLATSHPPAYPLAAGSYTVMAPLRSTSGAQRYVIPSRIDLSRQGSVLIWCERFNATMAWAPLR